MGTKYYESKCNICYDGEICEWGLALNFTCTWKTLSWPHYFTKRAGLCPYFSFYYKLENNFLHLLMTGHDSHKDKCEK